MIYESPDGGATVYARPINGKGERVLIEEPKYPDWHLTELEISQVVDYASEGNKSLQIRMLDKQKAFKERTFWQFFNVILPLVLLFGFGFGFAFWRKKKYSK